MNTALARRSVILVRARSWVCAMPVERVVETMRPLPIDTIEGAPAFVKGVSVVRGEVVPVVSLAAVLGGPAGAARAGGERFVIVRAGTRRVALLVEAVVGVEDLEEAHLGALPPLLSEAIPSEISRLGVLDGAALAVLDAARVLPESALEALDKRQEAATR